MSYFSSGFYQAQSAKQAWSLATDGDLFHFQVQSGDQRFGDPNWKERSEVRDLNRFAFGQDYTVSYSFKVEPGEANTAKWLLISQIHQTEDAGDASVGALFDIGLKGEKLAINVRWGTDQITTKEPPGKVIYLDSADITRGEWYDMTLNVRIDPFGKGLVDVWRNGVQIAHYEGAVGYNDAKGPYWKMGVYRSEAPETFAVDFKGLDISKGLYDGHSATQAQTAALAVPAAPAAGGISSDAWVSDAYANIMRVSAAGQQPGGALDAMRLDAGHMSKAEVIHQMVQAADATTSVATLSYQFFTGAVPSQAGIDYLVSPTSANPNNLNSAYYQSFNLENRYINFAVNLGKAGAGHDAFEAAYGSKSLAETVKGAYAEIFGATLSDQKVAELVNPRADYFASYGLDGPNGIGTKAAAVGWLLAEAAKSDLGVYAEANDAFLSDLADGASFGVSLIGAYGGEAPMLS